MADAHTKAMIAAFAEIVKQEQYIAAGKVELANIRTQIETDIAQAETELEALWDGFAKLMEESGEFEVILPGVANDYKIGWSNPRQSVKADAEAAPDAYVRIERKPKLKEIGELMADLVARNEPLPNWCSFQEGNRKLGWKAIKKTATKEGN